MQGLGECLPQESLYFRAVEGATVLHSRPEVGHGNLPAQLLLISLLTTDSIKREGGSLLFQIVSLNLKKSGNKPAVIKIYKFNHGTSVRKSTVPCKASKLSCSHLLDTHTPPPPPKTGWYRAKGSLDTPAVLRKPEEEVNCGACSARDTSLQIWLPARQRQSQVPRQIYMKLKKKRKGF